MASTFHAKPLHDPHFLIGEARALLDAGDTAAKTTLDSDLRHAYQLVAYDLARIEQLRQEQGDYQCEEVFGRQMHDKLAALLFITKHKLVDVVYGSGQTLDIVDARRDLSLYIEIFFRLHAAEALGALHDFAFTQQQQRDVEVWQKIALHYLLLMARMAEARVTVIHFLRERQHARRQVEQLIASPDPATAATFRALGEDYVKARKADTGDAPAFLATPDPPLYMRLFPQYDQRPPDLRMVGFTAFLAAEERIRQAVNAVDLATIVRWITDGSQAAIRAAFQLARGGLSTNSYIQLLQQVLDRHDLPHLQLTAVVLELSDINRMLNAAGGETVVNALLIRVARTREESMSGVARVAVRQLRAVNAFNDVLTVIEKAPVLEVAEEGIHAMLEMRHLPLVESVTHRRPALTPAYNQASRQMLEIQNMMDAIWSCQSEAMARVYLDRLKQLRALPELELLGVKHQHIHDAANRTLAELKLEMAGPRR